jgi:ASC-1-like (ASCH) protein
MEHQSKLREPYYEFVKEGLKTFELRIYDEKRKTMKIGDTWKFIRDPDMWHYIRDDGYVRTTIENIRVYKSFKEAIEDVGLEQLLPYINDVEEAVRIYEGFDNGNYKKESEEKGVVCFTIKVKKLI